MPFAINYTNTPDLQLGGPQIAENVPCSVTIDFTVKNANLEWSQVDWDNGVVTSQGLPPHNYTYTVAGEYTIRHTFKIDTNVEPLTNIFFESSPGVSSPGLKVQGAVIEKLGFLKIKVLVPHTPYGLPLTRIDIDFGEGGGVLSSEPPSNVLDLPFTGYTFDYSAPGTYTATITMYTSGNPPLVQNIPVTVSNDTGGAEIGAVNWIELVKIPGESLGLTANNPPNYSSAANWRMLFSKYLAPITGSSDKPIIQYPLAKAFYYNGDEYKTSGSLTLGATALDKLIISFDVNVPTSFDPLNTGLKVLRNNWGIEIFRNSSGQIVVKTEGGSSIGGTSTVLGSAGVTYRVRVELHDERRVGFTPTVNVYAGLATLSNLPLVATDTSTDALDFLHLIQDNNGVTLEQFHGGTDNYAGALAKFYVQNLLIWSEATQE